MAITAIVGRPGHGKSYSAVDLAILPAIKEGRRVFTNIPLKLENIYRDYPEARITQVRLDQAENEDSEFWLFEPGALIVLDELWRVWPSGLKANKIPVHQLSFIKEHRHRTDENGRWQDIVLVTQNLSDIAAPVRDMTETTVMCGQLQDMGAADWFVREYYTGAVRGLDKGPEGKRINNERIKYQFSVYQYYVSNTQGKTAAGPQGAKVVKQTMWTSWKFKAAVVVLFLALFGGLFSAKKSADGIDKLKQQAAVKVDKPVPIQATPAPIQAAPVPMPVAPLKPPEPQESRRWRLVGWRNIPGVEPVAFASDGRHTRRILARKYCNSDDGEMVCTVQGEIIARWTGPHNTGINYLSGAAPALAQAKDEAVDTVGLH